MFTSNVARVASMMGVIPVSGWLMYTYYSTMLEKQQLFDTVLERKEYEIRRYKPYMKAEITLVGTGYLEALDKGRAQLDQPVPPGLHLPSLTLIPEPRYTMGANSRLQTVEVVRPTHVKELDEVEAANEPLFTHLYERINWEQTYSTQKKYRVSYILESKYIRPMVGKPNNPSIQIREVFVENAAAYGWFGWPTTTAIERRRKTFEELLKRDGIPYNNIRWADYNDKFAFPFLRRNELIAQISEDKF